MNKSRRAARAYRVRLFGSLCIYAVLLAVAIWAATMMPGSPWRFAVMALPVPALVATVWAVGRWVGESDEFESRQLMESLAIGFAGGSLLTFTYGLMQSVGAPPLNWMLVWPVYAACWLIGRAIVWWRYR